MLSLNIFLIFIGFVVLSFLTHIILYLISRFKDKKETIGVFEFILKVLFKKETWIPLLIATLIFICASILPYLAQENDKYLVSYYERNITLFQQYIADYTTAAQKQIQEYQKMQSDMARSATPLQLQFWSQQIDVVGNKLTDTIKNFNDKIMDQQISINEAKSRLELRPKNKWFFGIE